jgi:hypothetical protein
MPDKKQLFDDLRSVNYFSDKVTYEQFEQAVSTPEKASALFQKLREVNYYTEKVTEEKFINAYFSDLKKKANPLLLCFHAIKKMFWRKSQKNNPNLQIQTQAPQRSGMLTTN